MNGEEPELIESKLSRFFTWHGYRLEICIYHLASERDWTLEVVNEAGTSIVWDEVFPSDRQAYDQFQTTLHEEGIEAFLDDPNVLPFRPAQPDRNDEQQLSDRDDPMPKPTGAQTFNEIATVRIELRFSNPVIWRELEVPTSMTLEAFHETIQIAMGWFSYHLWEFHIGSTRYGPPMDDLWADNPSKLASKTRLRDVLSEGSTPITYIYDFGDDWVHDVTVSNVRQGDTKLEYPRYLGGEFAGPPEDCGGIPGFYGMLEVLADPSHPDHAEISEWLDEYDPVYFDELPIRAQLSRIARRRNAVAKRLNKSAND